MLLDEILGPESLQQVGICYSTAGCGTNVSPLLVAVVGAVRMYPIFCRQSPPVLITSTASPLGCTNIQSLDAHLFNAVPHHASPLSSLNRKDVLEIQAPSLGKTHLLMHLMMTCIIPRTHLSLDLGGWGKAAVLLDADDTFNMRRFRQLLTSRLTRLLPLHLDVIPELIHVLLQNVHVFRPKTSYQLAFSILNLANYHANSLPNTEVGLVAIDSISAFYWQDRLFSEQPRDPASPETFSGIKHALKALEQFRQSHGPIVVLTNWGLKHLSKSSPFYRQHLYPMHSPFSANSENSSKPVILPLTHHITLRVKSRHSPEAEGEQVEGLVRSVEYNGVGSFNFFITDNDILVENETSMV
jgi:DNA-repair protein XRCC2